MPHDAVGAGPGRLPPAEARKITAQVTTLSVSVAVILSVTKAAAWWASGSVALLASLADSALDLTASLVTFFAVRYAATPADAEHRYGHGKAEGLASAFQSLLVAMSAALLLREGVDHMLNPRPVMQGGWAIAVMGLSILLTAFLIWRQARAVAQTGSVAVEGDRVHYMSDFASNIAVIIGVAGAAFFGALRLDGLVAIGVALWLGWSAWEVARGALAQLVDRELPDRERRRIIDLAEDDDQILGIHQLRTRAAGPLVHIQFHADLSPDLTLREAHDILVACENRILKEWPAADILIHPDPKGFAEPHGAAFFKASDAADEPEENA